LAARSILFIFDSISLLILDELIAIVYFKFGYLSNKKFIKDTSPSKSPLLTDGSSSK
jgi:hypothetical protein